MASETQGGGDVYKTVSTRRRAGWSSTREDSAARNVNQAKKNDDKCGKCEVVIEDNPALKCDICKVWFHIRCQKVPVAVYNLMVEEEDGKQLDWKCTFC